MFEFAAVAECLSLRSEYEDLVDNYQLSLPKTLSTSISYNTFDKMLNALDIHPLAVQHLVDIVVEFFSISETIKEKSN